MSDLAAADRASSVADDGPPAALNADAILADFREWLLQSVGQESGVRSQESGIRGSDLLTSDSCLLTPDRLTPKVDLFTLIGQFTALRHEVNLQTKAARAATEQNAEVLRQLAATPKPTADDELRPLLKATIDIADAIALSLRQMERLRESAEPLLEELNESPEQPELSPRPGFFARLFGAAPPPAAPLLSDAAAEAADKLRQLADAAADGYAMSLRRIERVLPTYGLDPIPCEDQPFDPERMEVVDVVTDSDAAPGTVVEEVRAGYMWRGKVFRFAQVKVAR